MVQILSLTIVNIGMLYAFHFSSMSTRRISNTLVMRKQKASNKRTSRLQRGGIDDVSSSASSSFTTMATSRRSSFSVIRSPMETSPWKHKSINSIVLPENMRSNKVTGGRGRSRKRFQAYASLAFYHSTFLELLTKEFRQEEEAVYRRIEETAENPLLLESAGLALFDMVPQRRGSIFTEEVFRLTKPAQITQQFSENDTFSKLKFSNNDIIVLTLQEKEGTAPSPLSVDSVSVEARVLNTGPYYIDAALSRGLFQSSFGAFDDDNVGMSHLRIRVDRFFSNLPYTRMVTALTQLTSVSQNVKENTPKPKSPSTETNDVTTQRKKAEISIDSIFKEVIVSTFQQNEEHQDSNDVQMISKLIAKPPLPNSASLASQVLNYMQQNPNGQFQQFNGPQLNAIASALTRRLTLIQGPPGTGKTTVAAAIAFGFVHQCRNISPFSKVLACAFSNVGADNLVEHLLKVSNPSSDKGSLKVIRIGKASAVKESLWDFTLESYISKDPSVQRSLELAASATAKLTMARTRKTRFTKGDKKQNTQTLAYLQAEATAAVKASNKACQLAATRILREADVIVSTCIGAADPYLLAACGYFTEDEDLQQNNEKKTEDSKGRQLLALDGKPSLILPFVLIDEACQSVEPATLIPITSTDTCRSVVLLGDPCQLPPTVISESSLSNNIGTYSLSKSLMTRLSSILPPPLPTAPIKVFKQSTSISYVTNYLSSKTTKQAVSLVKASRARKSLPEKFATSYMELCSGSYLLSVQYRMHASISCYPSAIFYDSLLSTPRKTNNLRVPPPYLSELLPASCNDSDSSFSVRFINVNQGQEEKKVEKISGQNPKTKKNVEKNSLSLLNDTSYSNEEEAMTIVALVKKILQNELSSGNNEVLNNSIGIVTPYSSQVSTIRRIISSDSDLQELLPKARNMAVRGGPTLEVYTVDSYQGHEKDIIIFSTVRSNKGGKIGFLKDWRRMNVALTRAKSGLIIVGDMKTLVESNDTYWSGFCKWCHNMGCTLDIESCKI